MKVKKAIASLEQLKAVLYSPIRVNNAWLTQAVSYMKDYFGEESPEYFFMTRYDLNIYRVEIDDKDSIASKTLVKNKEAAAIIDACIETIKVRGLYQKPKDNFLQRFSDNTLGVAFSIIVPGLCWLGYTYGQYTSDVKNFDLRQEVKILNEKLLFVRDSAQKASHQNPTEIKKDSVSEKKKGKIAGIH